MRGAPPPQKKGFRVYCLGKELIFGENFVLVEVSVPGVPTKMAQSLDCEL